MRMSPYTRVMFLEAVAMGGCFLVAIIALALDQGPFALLGIVVATIPGLLAINVRCPRCGKPVLGGRFKGRSGPEWYYWGGWPSKVCRDCGMSLTTF